MLGVLAALGLLGTVAGESRGVETSSHVVPYPTRPLDWKDINVISLSDSHGWLLGHQHATWPEPNYSGDYGSFASFVTHMRAIADERKVDLLLVDAGDHHDGSGLVSSTAQGADEADAIFAQVAYDVVTIGNHELYQYRNAKWLYDNIDRYNGRYVTSNVNITVKEDGNVVSRPIGKRFLKFNTKQGHKVTAFGVIFDFYAHDKNITVQSPTLLSLEPWFLEAVDEEPDYFILAGHMPARYETAEWTPVFNAIRRRHPTVPILIFGGHTHVRDCVQYDDHAIAVVPGRYLETVAFTSSSLPDAKDPFKPLDMTRRYLDANTQTYKWHTNQTDDFELPIGRKITLDLLRLSSKLRISKPLGIAPRDLFMTRHPFGHPDSVLTEWTSKVLPETVYEEGRSETRLIITQSGSIRFDLFQGPFSRNDELTISPFVNSFVYTSLAVPLARKVVAQLNRAGASKLLPLAPRTPQEEDARVDRLYDEWVTSQADQASLTRGDQVAFSATDKALTIGYVTHDACPGKGDDIEHAPLPRAYKQPDFISTPFPEVSDEGDIDVVVMDFSLDDFLAAVNFLDPVGNITAGDMKVYAKGTLLNHIWGDYAQRHWKV